MNSRDFSKAMDEFYITICKSYLFTYHGSNPLAGTHLQALIQLLTTEVGTNWVRHQFPNDQ